MADTRRSKTDNLALWADNVIGAISPQDGRDLIVTVLGGYASMTTTDSAVAQGSIGTTPVLLTTWTANGDADGLIPDHTTDDITVDIAGVYKIDGCFSFLGTSNATFQLHLRIDGVEQAEGIHRKLSTGGDVGASTFVAIKTLTAGQKITVWVESGNAGGTDSITPVDAQLTAHQIA